MNTTEGIRRYINDHQNQIVDAAFLHKTLFPIVDKHTFLKILSRLSNEGVIKSVDRGVYAPIGLPDDKIPEAIVEYYIGETNGILCGDALYNELGLSDQIPPTIKLYTNRLDTHKKKHVLNYELIGADLIFDDLAKDLVTFLELIENYKYLIALNANHYAEIYSRLANQSYPVSLFERIISVIKYQESTITAVRKL